MDAEQKLIALLARYHCDKIRTHGKHNIYRLPSGESYVTPKSASDSHAWDNCLAHLKVKLGLSRRGKAARMGTPSSPKKKFRRKRASEVELDAPPTFNFGEKVRAAIRGEKLRSPEPLPPLPKLADPPRYKPPRRITERAPRPGAVRQWSKDEIEAANIAMRVGQLNEFMQHHHQASLPEAILNEKQETNTMLSIDQIDQTITELDAGMARALEAGQVEASSIRTLETEIEQAKLRLTAANDKHNSLNDLKVSLSVLRSDIEKVRPMLGMLATKPTPMPTSTYVRRRSVGLAEAIRRVLEQSERPLRCAEIHAQVKLIPGCETVARTSLYTFFTQDIKKNGDAIAHRVGDNQYWRAGRSLPAA